MDISFWNNTYKGVYIDIPSGYKMLCVKASGRTHYAGQHVKIAYRFSSPPTPTNTRRNKFTITSNGCTAEEESYEMTSTKCFVCGFDTDGQISIEGKIQTNSINTEIYHSNGIQIHNATNKDNGVVDRVMLFSPYEIYDGTLIVLYYS